MKVEIAESASGLDPALTIVSAVVIAESVELVP